MRDEHKKLKEIYERTILGEAKKGKNVAKESVDIMLEIYHDDEKDLDKKLDKIVNELIKMKLWKQPFIKSVDFS